MLGISRVDRAVTESPWPQALDVCRTRILLVCVIRGRDQLDADRDALDDFGEVPCCVVRRQQSRRGSGRFFNGLDPPIEYLAGERSTSTSAGWPMRT